MPARMQGAGRILSAVAARFRGWSIVGWFAAAMGLWIAAVFLVVRAADPGLVIVIRGTARVSFVLFTISFAAEGLHRLWPLPALRWLSDNRGYVFLAFSVSHLYHAAAIISLAVRTRGESVGGRLDVSHLLGTLTYLAIVAIAVGYVLRRGGEPDRRPWRLLHIGGLYVIRVAFTFAYATKSLETLTVIPLVVVSLLAAILRRLR